MIILPMAGMSSRFLKAGYELPKYMLPLEGRSVFSHALTSFKRYFDQEQFVIICRQIADTPDFVRAECLEAGLAPDKVDLVVLEEPTAGQAETVARGLDAVRTQAEDPLTIFNIDTFRPSFRYPNEFSLDDIDGYIEVFVGKGSHWSFVRPDEASPESQRAIEVAEKERISELCSTGLYFFRSIALFQELYATIADRDPKDLQGGERYIAPLYNTAIQRGYDIRFSLISQSDVTFCGTPEEYETLKSEEV